MAKKILIIGGVAGGATAAARARRLNEHAEIVLFERGEYISFANCGLPYYIGGVIKNRDDLFVTTVDDFKARYQIDIRVLQEVVAINREDKTVTVKDTLSGQSYQESYDKIILSPGAEPIKPPMPGADLPNVYTLRNVPDTDLIKKRVDSGKSLTAVVIGGGFIGLEMAENLLEAGVQTTVIEAFDQVLPPLDIEMASAVHETLKDRGIRLELGSKVTAFSESNGNLEVSLDSKESIICDFAILSIGVKPDNKVAVDAELELNERGGIITNESLQSSDEDIYAVGDAIQTTDITSSLPSMVPLAGPANKQGRIAADNASGRDSTYGGVMGTSILKLFNQTVATTGLNEKRLKQLNIPYQKSYTHSFSHATYYPAAERMSIKLLFDPESGRVLGAQIIGGIGVDKRIDVLAVAIYARLTVYDLGKLETAYAPPYSSAKDPVNIAGFVASNILKEDIKIVHWDESDQLNSDRFVGIDLRTKPEIQLNGMIPNTINIPMDDLRNRLNELDKDKTYILYCAIGLRGYLGYRILSQHGFNALTFSGGYEMLRLAEKTNGA